MSAKLHQQTANIVNIRDMTKGSFGIITDMARPNELVLRTTIGAILVDDPAFDGWGEEHLAHPNGAGAFKVKLLPVGTSVTLTSEK